MSSDKIFEKITQKTNVKKDDIFSLANSLQNKNLKDEKDIKEFIDAVSSMAGKKLPPQKVDHLVEMIKNNKVPKNMDKML